MIVHTKWEMLVQKILKSVELFKNYGLFGEPKFADFLGFLLKKNVKKNDIFGHKHFLITT
jgi:hypothetical protein